MLRISIAIRWKSYFCGSNLNAQASLAALNNYVRRTKQDRPTWHYEPAATLIIGDKSKVELASPFPFNRSSASLQTKNLHLVQALNVCAGILVDKKQPTSDRSIALCWVAHLIADAHQPLHAGSVFAPGALSKGDRGGNEIPTKQGQNLHSLWDGLLGKKADNAMNRRMVEITSDAALVARGKQAIPKDKPLDPSLWLSESRDAALAHAYTEDVRQAITEASRANLHEVMKITLSEDYLKNAGRVAQVRAIEASYRLAKSLHKFLR